MSQEIINCQYEGKDVEVLIGWDSPLQRFYLVIQTIEIDEEDEKEGLIYSNLNDEYLILNPSSYQTINYFQSILEKFKITIPETIWEKVKLMKLCNV